MQIHGLLVIYGDRFRDRAEKDFRRLLRSVDIGAQIKIVSNGGALRETDIIGSNANNEFSGWDEAMKFLDVSDDDIVIFANDTFSTRNDWGFYSRARFKKSLRKLFHQSAPGACGEVNAFPGDYFLFGVRCDFWFRTHIFVLNGAAVKKLGSFCLSATQLESAVRLADDGGLVWSELVGEELRSRIADWLYPSRGKFGWYRSQSASSREKLKKAQAILNEKWLACLCKRNGVEIYDFSPSVLWKFYRHIQSRFNQLVLRR